MDCDTAFKQLKNASLHAQILTMHNFNASFMVETDASNVAVCYY